MLPPPQPSVSSAPASLQILDVLGLDVYQSLACSACGKVTRRLRFTEVSAVAVLLPLDWWRGAAWH